MTYYSANHYAIKAEKSMNRAESAATRAESAAAQSEQATGKIVQLGFDGAMQDGLLVFTHAPSGVEVPYELLDDYEYEIDLSYNSLEDLSNDVQMYVKNGNDIVTFVSALHRDSSSYATVKEMSSVMRFNEDTGYRWLFKAAFKIAPNGTKVLLLYPVISSGGAGAGLEIGDIGIAPLGIDETKNLRRYLNGQVISQTQFVAFTNLIKQRVLTNPSLATTEENWQSEVNLSKLGQCGKFVVDDNAGTIRLPKVVNINGLQDLALMGSIKNESLPNITGNFSVGSAQVNYLTGAFYSANSGNADSNGNAGTSGGGFDASLSSSTYQDNAPVQQEAIQYPYFIQVATGNEEQADITTEIQLNNPFSLLDYKWSEYELTNASWLLSNGAFHSGATYPAVYDLLLRIYNGTETKDGVSVKLSTEVYEDTDFVLNTADTTFRLPVKVLLASGNRVAGNGMTLGLTDGTHNFGLGMGYTPSSYSVASVYTKVYGTNVGTQTNVNQNLGNPTVGVTTDPDKSGIETSSDGLYLYFYVGETIQDANIISASQVLTKVANGIDRTSATDRETVVGWGMPDYDAGVLSENLPSPYICEYTGWYYVYIDKSGTNKIATIFVNGTDVGGSNYSNQYSSEVIALVCNAGDIITAENAVGNKFRKLTYIPFKGVNNV